MKPDSPRLTANTRGVFATLAIVLAIASTTLFAQFSSFDPSFDGELWGVRHEITPGGGASTAGVAFIGGTLYLADSNNQTVIAYDSAGQVVPMPAAEWDTTNPLSPVFGLIPNQLAAVVVRVNNTNRNALLITDRVSNRVAAFDAAGDYLFTLRLQRPAGLPPVPLSMTTGQVAMSNGARFNLATATNTLTLTGSFAAAWREQETTGAVFSGALAFLGATSTFPLVGGEFQATASSVLTGTESNPVAPAPLNVFGVTFDTLGNLYVLDAFTERLHVYDPAFTRLFTFGTPVADGTTAEFFEPWGLAFWPDASGTSGRLFINDTYNSRVVVYRPVDGPDAGTVVDALQFETVIKNFVAPDPAIELFSIAIDTASGRIAVTDFAQVEENAVPRLVILQRPRLAAFNFQVLDEDDAPISSVCTAAAYKIRFSLTVPAGLANVNGVTPRLLIDNLPTGAVPTGATFPTTLSGGQVAAYTYALTAPASAGDDLVALAGATANNTTDILQRSEIIALADCAGETDPSTITAAPSTPPQVSGWTPVLENQTFFVTLTAQDDDGIESVEYKLSGANSTGDDPVETEFDGAETGAVVNVPIPDFGRTTLSYRVRDGNGIFSAWQTLDVRTKLVVDRLTNENTAVEFRVGDPEGAGFTYSVQGLPAGVTFSAETGQFAGVMSFDAVQPYSSDPVLASGVYNVVVTETSAGGATSSVGFTWTVNHINRPPIITTELPGVSIQQGQPFTLQIDGFDPDNDPTVFTLRGLSPGGRELPPSITIDRDTGLISGSFPFDSDLNYDIAVGLAECGPVTNPPCAQALPGERLATLAAFSVAVLDANLPADIVNPGPQVSAEGATVSLQIAASDAEGDLLTYAAGGLPPGLTIDPVTGAITGALPFTAAGPYAVTVEVDDHVNTPKRSVTFAWTVTDTNRPPVVSTLPARVDLEGSTIQGISVGQYAFDPDGSPLTFVSALGLPDGISLSTTGALSGSLDFSDAGVYQVTVNVSDGELTTAAVFSWTVLNFNRPPELVTTNQSSREGQAVTYQLPASDPDGDSLFFTFNGLPPGLTMNETTGLITGTAAPGSAGLYTVNVGVRDVVPSESRSIFRSFTWIVGVQNRPPDVVNPGNQISNEGAMIALQIVATDPDGDGLAYVVTGLPATLAIDGAGRVTGTLGYSASGTYTVTVRATDVLGLSDAETFTWTINNVNTAPTARADSATVIQLAAVTIDVRTNDSDAEGDALTLVGVSAPTSGLAVINANGTITFTATSATFAGTSTFSYTISDGELVATAQVTVTIVPRNVAPVCTAAAVSPGLLWPPNHKPRYITIAGVTDPDGGVPTITFTSVLQDEPTNTQGDGNTTQDAGIENNGAAVWVRAERMGGEDGRVYIIAFTATDAQGASCSGTVFVGVPHDQGNHHQPIPGAGRWNSITGALMVAPPVSASTSKKAKK